MNLSATSLEKEILSVRFSDINKMRDLCEELLGVASANNDLYGIAFANLYLFDYYSYKVEDDALFYLIQTQNICEEHDYQDLLMTFHNLAGLYYQDLFDEHSALKHFLLGLELAQKLKDPITESKIYNNIGHSFRRRYDNENAIIYFRLAYNIIEPYITEQIREAAISFLCNIAEVAQVLGVEEESIMALNKATKLNIKSMYEKFNLAYSWCGHYARFNEREKSIAIAREMIAEGICEFEHVKLKISTLMELCDYMLLIDCQELALIFLQALESLCSYRNIGNYYNCLIFKLKYYERYGTIEECQQVYQEFYKISLKMNEVDNNMRVQNVLSKIELTKALYERQSMSLKNKELENASHIDELTQLYNRRYLSKLKIKVLMGKEAVQLGYIMLDIDYFKQYNDFYGHFKGDEAIKIVADILRATPAKEAYSCRYGGDEFLVLCVDWTNQEMEDYIHQIQLGLLAQPVPHEKSPTSQVLTLSIGYSNNKVSDEKSLVALLEWADQALYEAKENGRNGFQYKGPTNK